jgi:hypothetical protein
VSAKHQLAGLSWRAAADRQRGCGFRSISDTIPAGRMTMQTVGAFAGFERAMIRERASAGLAGGKSRGAHFGAVPHFWKGESWHDVVRSDAVKEGRLSPGWARPSCGAVIARVSTIPMMLLLKLTLAPLLVAAAMLVAQKWGPRMGGLLMGLPLTTGPIFLFLAIDQGPHFAAGATVGILFGLVGLAAFAVAYAAASSRTGGSLPLHPRLQRSSPSLQAPAY